MSATKTFLPPPVRIQPRALPPSAGAAVEVRALSKRFGSRTVLQDINLDIAAGESIAIVGRSGSGKSTFLRLLAGIEKPDTGGIWINHQAVQRADDRIRVMFQESRLLPWKRVIDNVRIGLSANRRHRAAQRLAEVGLEGREKEWPGKLSGGQQQRVALARALAAQPDVLLLDEPLSALDALTRLEMQTLIERLWREHRFTLILVTHDVEEAVALADRVLVMTDGSWSTLLPVELPRPRDRAHPAFVRRRTELLRQVMSKAREGAGETRPEENRF